MLNETLDAAIREFTPIDGDWRPLDNQFDLAFSDSDPSLYYHAMFNLFERFPEDDGSGVFWSALHGMEAVGGYENLLLQYHRRWPNLMTNTMLRRMLNAGETNIGGVEIASLLSR
jgi:hypothetical protein